MPKILENDYVHMCVFSAKDILFLVSLVLWIKGHASAVILMKNRLCTVGLPGHCYIVASRAAMCSAAWLSNHWMQILIIFTCLGHYNYSFPTEYFVIAL